MRHSEHLRLPAALVCAGVLKRPRVRRFVAIRGVRSRCADSCIKRKTFSPHVAATSTRTDLSRSNSELRGAPMAVACAHGAARPRPAAARTHKADTESRMVGKSHPTSEAIVPGDESPVAGAAHPPRTVTARM